MWQRFTERARRVVFFAQQEASHLDENNVSTEHLLLGMLHETDSVAGRLLEQVGCPAETIRTALQPHLRHGEGKTSQDMQLTPRAKNVIDLAYEEARQLDNNYIGTEHLLLGLIRESEGLAGQVLAEVGVQLEAVRAAVRVLQSQPLEASAPMDSRNTPPTPDNVPSPSSTPAAPQPGDLGVLQSPDGRASVELVLEEGALEEFQEVMRTRDAYGYEQLHTAGKFTVIPADTEAKFLRTAASGTYLIRLLSGNETGQKGYVAAAQFQRTGPDERPFPPT